MRSSSLFAFVALASALAAQGAIVSPVGAATLEGSGSNGFPFSSTVVRRYMQIHSDLGTTPLVITRLGFRVTAGTTNYTGTRDHDLELYMGEGRDALNPSYTFDNNYNAPKTLVMPRGIVTFGPSGQAVTPGPNPFTGTMDLVLPQPFVYSGTASLIWEVGYYGNTSVGTSGTVDAEQGVVTSGTSAVTGTGCIASGQAAAMTHTFTASDIAGTLALNSTVTAGPASSLCFLAIGFSNPNLAVPGLCSNVYSDALITQLVGFTDAAGAITTSTPTATTFVLPNGLAGVSLFTQVFAIDAGSANPIQFAASNGRSITVPSSNTTRVNLATRLVNNAGGTTATEAVFFTSTVGYALPVQFTHL